MPLRQTEVRIVSRRLVEQVAEAAALPSRRLVEQLAEAAALPSRRLVEQLAEAAALLALLAARRDETLTLQADLRPPRADLALPADERIEPGTAALAILACLIVLLPSAEQLSRSVAEAVLLAARIYHALAQADERLTETSVDYRFFIRLVEIGLAAAIVRWWNQRGS